MIKAQPKTVFLEWKRKILINWHHSLAVAGFWKRTRKQFAEAAASKLVGGIAASKKTTFEATRRIVIRKTKQNKTKLATNEKKTKQYLLEKKKHLMLWNRC